MKLLPSQLLLYPSIHKSNTWLRKMVMKVPMETATAADVEDGDPAAASSLSLNPKVNTTSTYILGVYRANRLNLIYR